MPRDQHLGGILKEFSALSESDRKAILKRLSPAERKALKNARRDEGISPSVRALAACSPWLARQLAPIVRQETAGRPHAVSEAAREALLNALHKEPVR